MGSVLVCLLLAAACGLLLVAGFAPAARHRSTPLFAIGQSNELKIRVGEILKPITKAGVFVGGPTNSIDVYACQPETLDLVVGHIHAWAQAERIALGDLFTSSVILGSLDRRRVIHMMGFESKLSGVSFFYTFEDFKKRADDRDGSPASLKESTHAYRCVGQFPPSAAVDFSVRDPWRHPFYTIDVFTSKRKESQDDVVGIWRTGMTDLAASGDAPEELISLHLLKSTELDPLAVAVVGAWGPGLDAELGDPTLGPPKLLRCPGWANALSEASKLAVAGTYTDLMEHTDPLSRIYFVCEVLGKHD